MNRTVREHIQSLEAKRNLLSGRPDNILGLYRLLPIVTIRDRHKLQSSRAIGG